MRHTIIVPLAAMSSNSFRARRSVSCGDTRSPIIRRPEEARNGGVVGKIPTSISSFEPLQADARAEDAERDPALTTGLLFGLERGRESWLPSEFDIKQST